MSYYPAWFDYAVWIFIIGGLACFAAKLSLPAGRKRGILNLLACLCIAVGVAFGGAGGLLFNLRAPRLKVQGTLSHVVTYRASKSSSTHFQITDAQQTTTYFAIDRALRQLKNGDQVELVYQAGKGLVLSLVVVNGTHSGLAYSQTDRSFGALAVLFIALAIALAGVIDFIINPMAEVTDTGDSRVDPSGVDSESMLHLEP